MPWIRLSDDYLHDEKFRALNDGAFRLWHEGLAYCRRHQTDGVIPFRIMRDFYSFTTSREKQLAHPAREGLAPLWELIPATGYKVHNYLAWNPSKDEELERRAESKERMRQTREQRKTKGVAPVFASSLQSVRANSVKTSHVVRAPPGHMSPGREEKGIGVLPERESERKPALSIEERASRLREELYPAWYSKWRNGARLRIPLIANSLEFQDALSLCQTWDDARLEKLAQIVLTTDAEPFIVNSDRGFKVFVLKASWAEDRLVQAEMGAGV